MNVCCLVDFFFATTFFATVGFSSPWVIMRNEWILESDINESGYKKILLCEITKLIRENKCTYRSLLMSQTF